MKRKVNSAKKGMVLMMTSVILFIATSIVAVLSTFVIITRNQKIEYEYISRNQIALKSKSYELFHKVLLDKFITTNLSLSDTIRVDQALIDNANVEFNGNIDVRCEKSPYSTTLYHYIYQFNTQNLVGYEPEELRDISIITTVDFNIYTPDDKYNASSYNISEMRFA